MNDIHLKIDFNAYYNEKKKVFEGGLYPILEYFKANKLTNALIRLDISKKNETTWEEVDLFCNDLKIKKLDYTINSEKYPKFTANVVCNYTVGKNLIKLLIQMALLGNGGHSYGILINDKHFDFDGDGADHISSINDMQLTSEIFNNISKQADILKKGNMNENKKLNNIIKESLHKTLNEISNSQIKRSFINKIHKYTQKATSKIYSDESWQGVDMVLDLVEQAIGNDGEMEVTVKNGGYWKRLGEFPNYKQYDIHIMLDNGIEINGVLKCHAAGTIEDTFKNYDITINLW